MSTGNQDPVAHGQGAINPPALSLPEPSELRNHCDALLEMWDERHKPEEHRAYVGNAFAEQLEAIRAILAATPSPTGQAPKE
jgi:hypothetical protein